MEGAEIKKKELVLMRA